MENPSSSAIWKASDVYKMKNSGPRMELWGMPNWTTVVEDVSPLYLMYCLLPTRYEHIQSSTATPNPNDTSSRPRRMSWSTQIEGSTQIEHTEQSEFTHVSCDQGVWAYLQEGGLCGMAASICRLMFRKETVRMEMEKQPLVDGPFE